MKYMLLIYSDESVWSKDEWQDCVTESIALCKNLQTDGQFIAAAPLHPVASATSVRIREGKALITDGPFAETHEQMGGFYLIDVASLDEAIEVASKIPGARRGTVEIRPVFDLPELPLTR